MFLDISGGMLAVAFDAMAELPGGMPVKTCEIRMCRRVLHFDFSHLKRMRLTA
jgi:hypothetical protein